MNINHRLSYAEKISNDNEYGRKMLDWVGNQSINFNYIHRKMITNYNMYGGKIDTNELKSYLATDLDNEVLSKLQHYDISISKLRTLLGEMIARPLNFQATATNKDAMNERLATLDKLLLEHASRVAEAMQTGMPQFQLEAMNKEGLKQIDKFMKSEFKLKSEAEANNILKYHSQKQNYKELFLSGFEHAMISAHECYWVGIKNEPVIEILNPLNIRYQMSPDLKNIEDADWACYEYYITLSDAYDFLAKHVEEEEQFEKLDKMASNNYNPNSYYYNQIRNYVEWNTVKKNFPDFSNPDEDTHFTINTIIPTFKNLGLNLVKVIYAEWKSLQKKGILTRKVNNAIVKDIVDETYKLDKASGDISIKWYWVNQVWSGYKVGDRTECLYLGIGPKKEQFNSIEDPYKAKLGFVGKVYNYVNSEPIALLDRAKPYQYLYNVISLQIERLLASDIGRVLMLDVNAIPDDMDYPDFAHILKTFRIAPFDTSKNKFKNSSFQGFGSSDLSMAQTALRDRLELLMYLQNRCSEVMGITKEREGRVNQNSNVSDNQQSIVQSNYITENEFFQHSQCIRNVLTQFLEVCKIYYKENPINAVMLDNNSPLNVTSELLPYYKYDIFLSDSSKDRDLIKFTDTISQALIQNGYKFSDVLKLMAEDYSISKKIGMLQELEKEREEQQAKQQEMEMQMKQQQMEMQYNLEQQKIQEKLQEEQIRTNAKLEIAQMNKDLAIALQQFKSDTQRYDVDKRTEIKEKEIDSNASINDTKQLKVQKDSEDNRLKIMSVNNRTAIDAVKNKLNYDVNKEKNKIIKKTASTKKPVKK